ncbi:MltA-interacting protein MipA [Serratia proteamaculans]|nr:MltA-interacting protein MipA [Serratia proteamaculans]
MVVRDQGHTAYLEVGASSSLQLSSSLTMDSALYGIWGDSHDMMARFGVTGEQAERNGFSEYHAGGGMRNVTLKTGLTVQLQPHLALQGGMKLYALTVGVGFYLNA